MRTFLHYPKLHIGYPVTISSLRQHVTHLYVDVGIVLEQTLHDILQTPRAAHEQRRLLIGHDVGTFTTRVGRSREPATADSRRR